MAHKHAALMLLFAQDAMESDTPGEHWEYRFHPDNGWATIGGRSVPAWYPNSEYRRKPKTILINGFEVPEPLRTVPKRYTQIFVVTLGNGEPSRIYETTWDGFSHEHAWLNDGLVHPTREAATLHAKALLSFTRKK